ncbi:isochorismatase family cysteine hydrolase [Chloroflexota bacterium]
MSEILDPSHTALVLWDIQNGLVNTAFNKEVFLQKTKEITAAARAVNIPVIYTKITPLPVQYQSPWRLFTLMRRAGVDSPDKLPPFMEIGSPQAEIEASLTPHRTDLVLNKYSYSIFVGTHFEGMMRNTGINTLLFTGIATEIGIAASAMDSSSRGFYTIVVEDCVSSSDAEMHNSMLKILNKMSLVMPSESIIKEWRGI